MLSTLYAWTALYRLLRRGRRGFRPGGVRGLQERHRGAAGRLLTPKREKRMLTNRIPMFALPTVEGVECVINVESFANDPQYVGDGDPTHLKDCRVMPGAYADDQRGSLFPPPLNAPCAPCRPRPSRACFKGMLMNDIPSLGKMSGIDEERVHHLRGTLLTKLDAPSLRQDRAKATD
jgi:hypothetical protein